MMRKPSRRVHPQTLKILGELRAEVWRVAETGSLDHGFRTRLAKKYGLTRGRISNIAREYGLVDPTRSHRAKEFKDRRKASQTAEAKSGSK